MKQTRLSLLAVFCWALLSVSSVAQQPTVILHARIVASDPDAPKVRVIVDKRRVRLGTEVHFTILPEELVKDPRYQITLYFGDKEQRVMHEPQITHLYRAVGTYTYSVLVDNPLRVTLSATPVAAEPDQQIKFAAQLSKPYTNVQYKFAYGDGSSSGWQPSAQAVHAYRAAGTYSANVEIGDGGKQIGKSESKRIDVTAPPSPSVYLTANPSTVQSGRPVVFNARVTPARGNTQYQFAFGDGQRTPWQGNSQTQHSYPSPGSYSASVQVNQSYNTQNLTATSTPTVVTVPSSLVLKPTPPPGPTPSPNPKPTPDTSPSPRESPPPSGSPSPGGSPSPITSPSSGPFGSTSPSTDNTPSPADFLPGGATSLWKWWPLPLAGLLLFLVYKATGYLLAAKPTFAAFSDPGAAGVANEKGILPLDFQLVLNPNVAGGDYSVTTDEARLVRNTDALETRQILEI